MSKTPGVDALLATRSDIVRCFECKGHQTLDRGDERAECLCWNCGGDGVVTAESGGDSFDASRAGCAYCCGWSRPGRSMCVCSSMAVAS